MSVFATGPWRDHRLSCGLEAGFGSEHLGRCACTGVLSQALLGLAPNPHSSAQFVSSCHLLHMSTAIPFIPSADRATEFGCSSLQNAFYDLCHMSSLLEVSMSVLFYTVL